MKKSVVLSLALVLFAVVSAFPQDKTDYSGMPGYVDFGNLAKYMSGDKVTEINLDANMLKMLSNLGGEDSLGFKSVVGGLKLIKVNSFGINYANEKEIMQKITSIDEQLTGKNWQRIIKVKDRGEYTNVYILPSKDYQDFMGLVVASVKAKGERGKMSDKNSDKGKEGEATFVNIVGKINMEQLGKLGSKFNIPSIGKMNKEKGSGGKK